ncbi:bifunctional diguanylate cyclase/phosphodiesterase [Paenibacillus alginolyticus]|uniref:EAL domain-containing protein n=1 Tax=Paenibacillus alginolyticus TaxID=59839 RepID=A0ABT4GE54_9BACL|nr:bifunctional diguanylate cyclase/phosphodiesterase [Paenibacillus alginolyticus]MCY9694469.1 EAL domain-containing protein [Paenibacillus alginolyticus]MEC0142055.1 EAL domain-containing protein [Paenibacillus alginolyticus]
MKDKLRLYARVFNKVMESIMITDSGGVILSVNPAFTTTTGYTEEEVAGQTPRILYSGKQKPEFYIHMWATIHETGGWKGEIWNRKKNGELYLEWLTISAVRDKRGKISNYVGIFMDITERRKSEKKLQLHARVFETASEGIMITDTKGTILSVNPAFSETTGFTEAEALGRTPRMLHSGVQDAEFYIQMWASIHEKGSWQGEVWNKRKNGEIYPEWLTINTVRNENGKISNYVGVFTDITERKLSEENLKYLAHYDVLTGLPNRFLFHDRLSHAIAQANRQGHWAALMFIDLDHFKLINDTLGHAVGDQLLQNASKRLESCVRTSDTVSRLGGDEFTVILPHIDETEDALLVAQKILEELALPFLIAEQELFITASIGISIYPFNGADSETLIKQADSAMYRAKEQSNNYQLYTSNMNATFYRKMKLENGLRKAMEKDQLRIVYQPQMDIRTGRINGIEALLRWQHPEMGMVSPNEFIQIVEENGQIVEIGEWVLRKVCEQNKAWQSAGYPPLKCAINLSPRQFKNKNLIETVKQILKETELDPSYLCFEITENISIHQIESVLTVLHDFKEIGLELAIDDFGKGHSALSYLKKYPIDTLKIDKCFVQGIEMDRGNASIAKAMIDMAHGLGLRVIAEGVETEDQLAFLKDLHCDSIQGYWLSRPLPPEGIESFFIADQG